jgi:hypothetical protein
MLPVQATIEAPVAFGTAPAEDPNAGQEARSHDTANPQRD